MKLLVKLSFLALTAAPMSAMALFEVRASYGIQSTANSATDICGSSCTVASNAPSLKGMAGFGADAIITLPLFPIGFGLRYENMGIAASSNGFEADVKYTRTALLLNYRLIDTIVHFGPIASYGLSHSGSAVIKEAGLTRVDVSTTTMTTYSVGLELLVKPLIVIPLTIGAEAGYMGNKWGDVTNASDGSKKSVDLSGSYMKIFLGLDI